MFLGYGFLLTFGNDGGIFVCGGSGGVAALRRRVDRVGAVVLGFAAACSGGIIRDVLIGALPPDNIRSWKPLAISSAAVAVTLVFYPSITSRLRNPVQVFDAVGLGLFAVLGADKAMAYGIGPLWSVLLGVTTSIGGGVVRDVLLARVPGVLRSEIYATAALLGAAILVIGRQFGLWPDSYGVLLGAGACILVRLLALYFGWQLPLPIRHRKP